MEDISETNNIINKIKKINPPLFLVILGMVIIFLVDIKIPTGTNIWVLYILPISITAFHTKKKLLIYILVSLSALFMMLDFFLGPQGIPFLNGLFNRVLGIIVVSLIPFFIYQLKKILGVLQEQKKQFENAVMDNPLPIMVRAEDGEVTLINKAWTDITGYSINEIASIDTWIKRAYRNYADEMMEKINAASKLKERINFGEFAIKTKTGEERIWDFHFSPLGNLLDGRKISLITASDITERKKIEEKLIDQSKYAEELSDFNFEILESSPYGIAAYDETGNCTYVNEVYHTMIGTTRTQALFQNFHSLDSWKRSGLYQLALDTINSGKTHSKELHITSTFGKELWIEGKVTPFLSGGKLNLLVTFSDISANRLAEIELQKLYKEKLKEIEVRKKTEETLRKLTRAVEQSPASVVITDLKGKINYVNPKFSQVTGYSYEEAVGNNPHILKSGFTPAEVYKQLWETILNGGTWKGEFCNRKKNGEIYWEYASISPIMDEKNNITHFVAVKEDITDRKLVEEELRKSEQRYRSLFGNMLEGYAYCQMFFEENRPVDFKFLDVNNSFNELTGLKDVIDKNVLDIIPGINNTNPKMLEICGRVALTGKPERFDVYLDDLKRWFSISVYCPEENYFVTVFDNITERKKAEKALRDSHEREIYFSQQLIILQEITNLLSKAGSFDELCYQAVQMGCSRLGFDRISIWFEGKDSNTIRGSYGIDEKGKIRDERNQVNLISSETPVWRVQSYKEPVYYFKDVSLHNHLGKEIGHGDCAIAPLWNGNKSIGFICIDNLLSMNEIMEQQREILGLYATNLGYLFPHKQAEEQLRESEERFHNLADAMPQLVRTANPDGSIDYYNERVKEFDGISQMNNGFWDWSNVIHDEDKQITEEAWTNAINTGGIFEIIHRLRKKDGSYRWFLSRGVPIRNSSGKIMKWFGTATDIHEQKKAEEELERIAHELERSNKELEQFAYIASHDLQEPIRMIRSYSQLIDRKYKNKLDSNADEYIKFITDGAARMQRLISDLLKYARVTTQGQAFEKVDCNEIINEVLEDLNFKIKEENAKIEFEELPFVKADRTQLRQVFQNLIYNALKFKGEAKPLIRIKCVKKKNRWYFYVEDNGIGIKKEYTERIFTIFQRLHSIEKYPGTGIGLAIVKKIIQRHGGEIYVESEPGKGSTFYFTLPV